MDCSVIEDFSRRMGDINRHFLRTVDDVQVVCILKTCRTSVEEERVWITGKKSTLFISRIQNYVSETTGAFLTPEKWTRKEERYLTKWASLLLTFTPPFKVKDNNPSIGQEYSWLFLLNDPVVGTVYFPLTHKRNKERPMPELILAVAVMFFLSNYFLS